MRHAPGGGAGELRPAYLRFMDLDYSLGIKYLHAFAGYRQDKRTVVARRTTQALMKFIYARCDNNEAIGHGPGQR
jgi:hypothetical protein